MRMLLRWWIVRLRPMLMRRRMRLGLRRWSRRSLVVLLLLLLLLLLVLLARLLQNTAQIRQVIASLRVSLVDAFDDFPLPPVHLVRLGKQKGHRRTSNKVAKDLPGNGFSLSLQLVRARRLPRAAGLAVRSRHGWRGMVHRSAVPRGGISWVLPLRRRRRKGWCRNRLPVCMRKPCLGWRRSAGRRCEAGAGRSLTLSVGLRLGGCLLHLERMIRIGRAVDALDGFRVVAIYEDGQHHRLRPRLRNEVVHQVEHELGMVARAGEHGYQVCVADIGNSFVPHHTVPLLGNEVIDQLLHARLGRRRSRLEVDHHDVRGQAVPETAEIDDGLLLINPPADSQVLGKQLIPRQANRLAEVGTADMLGRDRHLGDCVHDEISSPHHVRITLLLGRVRRGLRAVIEQAVDVGIDSRSSSGCGRQGLLRLVLRDRRRPDAREHLVEVKVCPGGRLPRFDTQTAGAGTALCRGVR